MKLSAQEEYGLRCVLHLARGGPGVSLTIPEISRAEGLSQPNVAKLMRHLRLGGLVQSARGQTGGYTLARPAESISLGAVLECLGGTLFGPRFCNRHAGKEETCTHAGDCSLRPLWSTMQLMLHGLLERTSLADLQGGEEEMRRRLEHWTVAVAAGPRRTQQA